jgi:hypothetical protein
MTVSNPEGRYDATQSCTVYGGEVVLDYSNPGYHSSLRVSALTQPQNGKVMQVMRPRRRLTENPPPEARV